MFWLEPGPLNVSTRHVVWLCRPRMSLMRIIAGEAASSSIRQKVTMQTKSAAVKEAPSSTHCCLFRG